MEQRRRNIFAVVAVVVAIVATAAATRALTVEEYRNVPVLGYAAAEGNRIMVWFDGGSDEAPLRVTVAEAAEVVRVSILMRQAGSSVGYGMDYLVSRPLGAPVGARQVVDHEGKPISVIPERLLATLKGL